MKPRCFTRILTTSTRFKSWYGQSFNETLLTSKHETEMNYINVYEISNSFKPYIIIIIILIAISTNPGDVAIVVSPTSAYVSAKLGGMGGESGSDMEALCYGEDQSHPSHPSVVLGHYAGVGWTLLSVLRSSMGAVRLFIFGYVVRNFCLYI